MKIKTILIIPILILLTFNYCLANGGSFQPKQQGAFILGAGVGYLQPSNDDSDYSVITSRAVHRVKSLNPDFDTAYQLLFGYLFANQHDYIFLHWQHFNTSDHNHVSVIPGQTVSPAFEVSSPLSFIAAKGNIHFKQNTVDLMYGHIFQPVTKIQIKALVGLRYFYLKKNALYSYATANNIIVNVSPKSKFQGVGPRFAVLLKYAITRGFSVIGRVGGSLILGSSKTEDTHTNSAVGVVLFIPKNSIHRIVPEFDGRLALRYTYIIHHGRPLPLSFEVGYQAADYVDALDRLNPIFNTSFNLLATVRTRSSYMIAGPYMKFLINI